MSVMFCEKCGTKLETSVNFCSACGNAVNKRNVRIVSLNDEGKMRLFNIIGFIIILLYSYQFYMQIYIYGFNWKMGSNMMQDAFVNNDMIILLLNFVIYIICILVLSFFFKQTLVSRLFVKVTFLASVVSIVMFTLHILYTLFLYIFINIGVKSVLGYQNAQAEDYVRSILQNQLTFLLIALISVVVFVLLVLRGYFKKQPNPGFIYGIMGLFSKPFQPSKFIHVVKEIE